MLDRKTGPRNGQLKAEPPGVSVVRIDSFSSPFFSFNALQVRWPTWLRQTMTQLQLSDPDILPSVLHSCRGGKV